MLKVYNDHLLVELNKSEWATSDDADTTGKEDPNASKGVVAAIPDLSDMHYLSSYSWISEDSVLQEDLLERVRTAMERLLGKTVYFEKRADLGNTIEYEGKTYATIKLTKIIAVEEN
jgi:hypothetical protein